MIHSVTPLHLRRTLLACAACAVFMPVHAQPVTTISVGAGLVDGSGSERALFGQYNGLRTKDAFGQLGIDYSLRNPDKASWVEMHGSNLLGDTRELDLVWKHPGSWKLSANYNELVHYDPVVITSATGAESDLHTKRSALGLGLTKIISPRLQLALDLKSENKDGSRLFGLGMNCPSAIDPSCGATSTSNTGWALLMRPEPVSANHSQIEARLSYAQDQLRLNAGYYGSFYRNDNGTLVAGAPASLNNPLGNPLPLSAGLQGLLNQPLALAPDNQAHQLDLSGSYDFTKTTRATFKLGYSTASQTQGFAGAGLSGAPAGVTNLGAQVDTRLAKIGLTAHPLPQLSLLADLRYEDKDDKTPLAVYNNEGVSSYTNHQLPRQKTNGKLQASWQFNSDYRGTVGADFESIDRGLYTSTSAASAVSALRQKTDETTIRADLRARLSDTLSGSLGLSNSQRDGSNWLQPNSGAGVTEVTNPAALPATTVFMPTLADRTRDKLKLSADWQPSEQLSLQFSAEDGQDKFNSPSVYGLQSTRMNQFSVDWNYALSETMALKGYLAQGAQTLNQARSGGAIMAFDNTNTSISVGFAGTTKSKVEYGASLSYMDDKSSYKQTLDALAGAGSAVLLAATGGLPDISYQQTALKLYSKYTLEKNASVRIDFVHQRNSVHDWTWSYNGVPFSYSDGTTVTQPGAQSVNVIGVTYIYQLP